MKKNSLFLAGMLVLALTACGATQTAVTTTAAATTAAATTAAETTAAETTAAAAETTAAAEAETEKKFIGCWQYIGTPFFMEIGKDHTFLCHHFDGREEARGTWEADDDGIILKMKNGKQWSRFTFADDNTLLDSANTAELISSSVLEVMAADEKDFVGTWEYMDFPRWISILGKNEYVTIDSKGKVSDTLKYKYADGKVTLLTKNGEEEMTLWLTDKDNMINDGYKAMFRSELPKDFASYVQDGQGGEEGNYYAAMEYFGSWKYYDYDMWLYVYDDGSFEWIYGNGDADSSYWYMGEDCLFLSNKFGGEDDSVSLTGDGLLIDQNGDKLYPEIPPFKRYW